MKGGAYKRERLTCLMTKREPAAVSQGLWGRIPVSATPPYRDRHERAAYLSSEYQPPPPLALRWRLLWAQDQASAPRALNSTDGE
ncbi:hypothetical protein NDU88_001318 [Pleurodeles waltl]|uniref:Uncharacterized protein n=1 Tax=Pleurodeles waltl TaxID=8319 RepID=A0AAV7KQ32_PLEWA|nr:hypothetical protein NDU88_001318 [Pleurodeles waltl]